MLLSDPLSLPCGLQMQNRLCKAAMAESMAVTHSPDKHFEKAYGEWADGGWGMIITGNVHVSRLYNGSPRDVTIPLSDQLSQKTAWKQWASACQRTGTPTVVQLCHPGRQSPTGAGEHGFFTPTIAPSAVKLNLGNSIIAKLATSFVFGTPREMTLEEIEAPGGVIDEFVAGARQSFEAGFKGIELHAAHGYLLAQFLSPKTNLRTDHFGGSPAKRAEVVCQIIRRVRKETSKQFCVGIKMNSVDASASESISDTMEQIQLIVDSGVDFIEISGGTYENPRMVYGDSADPAKTIKESTLKREGFFLYFAQELRARFPSVKLIVTGGFRTRGGMEHAIRSGACDMVGLARPAAVCPKLPKEIILNETEVPNDKATMALKPFKVPWATKLIPIKALGAGAETGYYSEQIRRMAQGWTPIDTRA